MVDLRPLFFINFLMVLLLITAGFILIDKKSDVIEDKAPEPWVSSNVQVPQKVEPNVAETVKENDASNNENKALAALKASEDTAFAEEAIFTDEISKPHMDQAGSHLFNASVSPNEFEHLKMQTGLNGSVVSYENSPPKQTNKPITTGKLIVRSNVNGDIVLVNGTPYGPTMLELELTPGSYTIEVAKKGYQDWSTQIDIMRGTSKTIDAHLEHYTKVDFKNGKWRNNIQTGEGHYIEEGKLEYNGSFVNGKFHGNGSIRYANGMKYQGNWFEGSMQGRGSLTTTNGDSYIGEMDDNKFNGEGTLTKATGDIYTGFWIDGVLNGQGSLTTKNGLLYVGGFSDNLFHGNGSLTYPDGGQYEGSFSNGMFHGKGVEIFPNGKKYVGQFIDGLFHGKGEILNPNGSKITGTFKDGKAFGKATLTTAEGEVFTARSSDPGVCYRKKSYRATECPQLEGW